MKCFSVAFAVVALCLLPASARGQTVALADYEISSSEGGDSKGTLTVGPDFSVIRRVVYPDTSVHTYSGKGQISGATLAVQFDSAGEPRNLTGQWIVKGETEAGKFSGTALFALRRGKWVGSYRGRFDEDNESTGDIEIRGRFDGLAFVGDRREGDAAPVSSASYLIAPDGLTLTAIVPASTAGVAGVTSGAIRETFTRVKVPATGLGPTALYAFEDGGKLSGTLSTGAKDRGAKVLVARPAATAGVKIHVAEDPMPSSLRAIKATSIFKSADTTSAVVKAVARNEPVPVCGREKGFWVVGPFKDPGQRRGWKGYVPEEDLDNRLRYADVPAPIFLPDKPLSAMSVRQSDLGTCYLDAALMAIASVQSSSIQEMIKDHGDGTVSVRFFRRAGGELEEEWTRIRKTIIVDERGRSHYTVGEAGELWPALVEKAFAAWRGQGWYRNIEGGNTGDVFEVVLGLPARSLGWNLPIPTELGMGRGGRGFNNNGRRRGGENMPPLDQDDLRVIATYRETDAAKKETIDLLDKPAARRDIAYLDSQCALLKKAGLSESGAHTLHEFYTARLDGPLGSGQYGAQAKEIFARIKSTLAAHLPVAMSTRPWGSTEGTGQSARENLQVVAGLASEHEYMVTDCYEDDHHICWVKVVNPWHRFARHYERVGDTLVARASGRRDTDQGGAFDVELSDVMRYYSSVAFVTH